MSIVKGRIIFILPSHTRSVSISSATLCCAAYEMPHQKVRSCYKLIILVRHGQYETEADSRDKKILTEVGWKQAKAAGRRLRELGYNYVYLIFHKVTFFQYRLYCALGHDRRTADYGWHALRTQPDAGQGHRNPSNNRQSPALCSPTRKWTSKFTAQVKIISAFWIRVDGQRPSFSRHGATLTYVIISF